MSKFSDIFLIDKNEVFSISLALAGGGVSKKKYLEYGLAMRLVTIIIIPFILAAGLLLLGLSLYMSITLFSGNLDRGLSGVVLLLVLIPFCTWLGIVYIAEPSLGLVWSVRNLFSSNLVQTTARKKAAKSAQANRYATLFIYVCLFLLTAVIYIIINALEN